MTSGIGRENCSGSKPWQGANYDQCKETLKIMQQGASNAYFPITKSSIYLPKSQVEFSKDIDKIFKEHNEKLIDLAQTNIDDQIDQQMIHLGMDLGKGFCGFCEGTSALKSHRKSRSQKI